MMVMSSSKLTFDFSDFESKMKGLNDRVDAAVKRL